MLKPSPAGPHMCVCGGAADSKTRNKSDSSGSSPRPPTSQGSDGSPLVATSAAGEGVPVVRDSLLNTGGLKKHIPLTCQVPLGLMAQCKLAISMHVARETCSFTDVISMLLGTSCMTCTGANLSAEVAQELHMHTCCNTRIIDGVL